MTYNTKLQDLRTNIRDYIASKESVADRFDLIELLANISVALGETLSGSSSTVTANLGTLNGAATETTLSSVNTKVPSNLTVANTRLLVDGSGVNQPVTLATTATVKEEISSTTTVNSLVSATTSAVLAPANPGRKGLSIYNDSMATLYVKVHNSAASLTSYSVKLPGNAYWEIPFNSSSEIRGIWDSVNGSAKITEYS